MTNISKEILVSDDSYNAFISETDSTGSLFADQTDVLNTTDFEKTLGKLIGTAYGAAEALGDTTTRAGRAGPIFNQVSITGTWTFTAGGTSLTGSGGAALTDLNVGEYLIDQYGIARKIQAIGGNDSVTIYVGFSTSQSAVTLYRMITLAERMDTKADLASPVLTGTPTAPTAAAGTDTTQIATTAFAQHMQSPAFTGTPTAPTAAAGTDTTQIATTAYVDALNLEQLKYGVTSINAFSTLYQQWKTITEFVTQKNRASMRYYNADLFSIQANSTSFPSSTVAGFMATVTLSDGRVYIVYQSNSSAISHAIFDPENGSIVIPNPSFPSVTATPYLSASLLQDGRVYIVYKNSGTTYDHRIYDPGNDSLTTPTGTFPTVSSGSYFHISTCLMPSGKVYIGLVTSTTSYDHRIYDPVADSLSTPSPSLPAVTDAANIPTCLLPSGKVYISYRDTSSAWGHRIYDPILDSLSTPTASLPTIVSFAVFSITLLPSGKVYILYSSSSTTFDHRIYDEVTDSLTTPTGTLPTATSAGYVSTSLISDGRIILALKTSSSVYYLKIYDPVTDSIASVSRIVSVSSAGYLSLCLLQDGRVYMIARSSSTTHLHQQITGPWAGFSNIWQFPKELFGSGMFFGGSTASGH